jgi:hypothetical protein
MGRLSKKAIKERERKAHVLLGTRISLSLNSRAKNLAAINAHKGVLPATVRDLTSQAVLRYMENAKTRTPSDYRPDIAESFPAVVRFRIHREIYGDIIHHIKDNRAKLSGPESVSELASVALLKYVSEEEEMNEFLSLRPEYKDGYKIPGE